ncbi:DsbA family protein [Candidatus Mesenet endosymbiont of Agriotes lineatus]|uniref:DsbA family protein n=1 Tax=Candidatus Mesenet endosymbiont of Agriotes lineatus TaxID=3077948 RepID=UPI0030D0A459
MLRILLLLGIIVGVASLPIVSDRFFTQNKKSLDKESVEKIVDDYISDNPSKILDSIIRWQIDNEKKNNEARSSEVKEQIKVYKNELLDFSYPTVGSKDSRIVVVEFFDYACGYCKKMKDDVKQLIAGGTVKYVFRDLPILGDNSLRATRAALAVHFIDSSKYLDFYDAALSYNDPLTDDAIYEIVKSIGIDNHDFDNSLNKNADKIDVMIGKSRKLANDLGINGIPVTIIGDSLFSGAVGYDVLYKKINELAN